ncbi:MAG: hypothetical protein M1828_002843 [Chrysothrix sp. TS-e1954]|nr:MAG: hypothetical protein M1828_002843 [Chrysothrix sp. TS-e1954]
MAYISKVAFLIFLFVSSTVAAPSLKAFEHVAKKRSSPSNEAASLAIDLGYDVYQGVHNTTTGLNTWKGIRYAEPPLGKLRWQAPRAPTLNRTSLLPALAYGDACPQSYSNAISGPINGTFGNEDCLFLNVWARPNATELPVLVWIHGGGYGQGDDAEYDMSRLTDLNKGNFIAISFQYRLGAFGFLSSDEVIRFGVVNAGLLDQQLALQWVQVYVQQFGGDPSRVTIFGESAGAGSVMLQDLAYGGTLGSTLFQNVWADYNDFVPTQAYMAFAIHAGCPPTFAFGNSTETVLECLVSKPSEVLQKAAFLVSSSGIKGFWAFSPVTDGYLITERPSTQLLRRKVNGVRALVGNNAEEGPSQCHVNAQAVPVFLGSSVDTQIGTGFTPQDITTEDDLISWLYSSFPLFSANDISKILLYYPSTNASVVPKTPEFSTLGNTGPTALNESEVGTGQQQRADNIRAEALIVCPSYWLAEAYSDKEASYKFQYSVPVATHGTDIQAYFGPAGLPDLPMTFQRAFIAIIGNFVTKNDPSIAPAIANAGFNGTSSQRNPASELPLYSIYNPQQLILNQTGGVPFSTGGELALEAPHNITEYRNPGLKNDFRLANAYTWEAGRGYRCDFWRSVGELLPS